MGRKQEIERKFLVRAGDLPPLPPGSRMVQGYLGFGPTVRARCEEEPGGERRGYLTIKGEGLEARDEFEYEIPFEEARGLLSLSRTALVSKTRCRVPASDDAALVWEIDVFDGANEGLIVAEIELPERDHPFERPAWLGEDVTLDPAYKNAALALKPFSAWGPEKRTAGGG